jgi:hypothetical protein
MFMLREWPWLGLVLASVLLLWSAVRRIEGPWWSRLRDAGWLLWVALPVYMLHQFEEHGVDALGRSYAFQGGLCSVLGHTGPLAGCPATVAFIFAVNVGSVWIALGAGALGGTRRALIGAAGLGIPTVNAVVHVVPAIRTGAYNPGLVTALALFVPYCVWTLRELVRQGLLRRGQLGLVVLSGVLVHAILIGSLLAYGRGYFTEPALGAIQLINGFIPIALGAWASRRSR